MIEKDLRGLKCPMNFVRAKLTLEEIGTGEQVALIFDRGEAENSVPASLKSEGYDIVELSCEGEVCRIVVAS